MTPVAQDEQHPITVAIANDYEVVVRGLAQMLEPFRDRLAVVELDVNVPNHVPVDVTLCDTFPQAAADVVGLESMTGDPASGKVVVYTWNMRPELVTAALDRGVHGYLGKSLPADDLVAAIEAVHTGEVVVRPDPVEEPVEVATGAWPGHAEGLTAREAEVVALITQGLSNQEIAQQAYLSINSVKTYVRSAYAKMGVARRSQAVLWGLDHGMAPDRRRRVVEPNGLNTPEARRG